MHRSFSHDPKARVGQESVRRPAAFVLHRAESFPRSVTAWYLRHFQQHWRVSQRHFLRRPWRRYLIPKSDRFLSLFLFLVSGRLVRRVQRSNSRKRAPKEPPGRVVRQVEERVAGTCRDRSHRDGRAPRVCCVWRHHRVKLWLLQQPNLVALFIACKVQIVRKMVNPAIHPVILQPLSCCREPLAEQGVHSSLHTK